MSPVLQIVPLIIRRLDGPSSGHFTFPVSSWPEACFRPYKLFPPRWFRRPRPRIPLPSLDAGRRAPNAAPPRDSCRLRVQGRPQKSDQLAGHRHRDDRARLVLGQPPEAATQPLLRLVRQRNHPWRLPAPPLGQRPADAGPVPIVPRRFHHQPPRQRVARLRDRPAAMTLPAGVLPGYQPQIRHQRPRRRGADRPVALSSRMGPKWRRGSWRRRTSRPSASSTTVTGRVGSSWSSGRRWGRQPFALSDRCCRRPQADSCRWRAGADACGRRDLAAWLVLPLVGGHSSVISASRMTAASLPPNVEENTVMPAKLYSGGASFISLCIVPVRFVASRM